MDRRRFLTNSAATFAATLAAGTLGLPKYVNPSDMTGWIPGDPRSTGGPAPLPEISAVVDILVPADPDVPGDFKGTDYYGDWVLAATLGDMGQMAVVYFLNKYAKQTAGRKFINCTPEEQMTALKQWVSEREDLSPMFNEMLTGVLTISVIGTYEIEDPDERKELFASMGWYDPNDPGGTFRIPCEGYVDAKMFPVGLKKGLQ
jgi:hypothetical protein